MLGNEASQESSKTTKTISLDNDATFTATVIQACNEFLVRRDVCDLSSLPCPLKVYSF